MLLKDWIQIKTRSIMPLTEWPLLCRISPPSFTSHVFPCCWDVPISLWGASRSPLSSPDPVHSRPQPRVGVLLPPRKCLTRIHQPVVAPVESWRDFFVFSEFQLFVISRIHYCKHLTFVFCLMLGEGEQEGEFLASSLSSAGTFWIQVLLDLLMRDSFMYGE